MAPLFDDRKLRQAAEDIARLGEVLDLTPRNADPLYDVKQFLDIVSTLRTANILRNRLSLVPEALFPSDTLFPRDDLFPQYGVCGVMKQKSGLGESGKRCK